MVGDRVGDAVGALVGAEVGNSVGDAVDEMATLSVPGSPVNGISISDASLR